MFITALAPFRAGGTQYSNTHLSPLTTHQSFRTGVLAKGLFSPPSPLKGGTEVVLFFQVLMFFTTPAPFRAGGIFDFFNIRCYCIQNVINSIDYL